MTFTESAEFVYGDRTSREIYNKYIETIEKQPLNWEAADEIYAAFLSKLKAETWVGIISGSELKADINERHNDYIHSIAKQYRDIYKKTVQQRPNDRETEEITFDAFMSFAEGRNLDSIMEDVKDTRRQFNKKYKRNLIFSGLSLMGRPF